jgi:hypothetical protein
LQPEFTLKVITETRFRGYLTIFYAAGNCPVAMGTVLDLALILQ